jgi:hypothetical protein
LGVSPPGVEFIAAEQKRLEAAITPEAIREIAVIRMAFDSRLQTCIVVFSATFSRPRNVRGAQGPEQPQLAQLAQPVCETSAVCGTATTDMRRPRFEEFLPLWSATAKYVLEPQFFLRIVARFLLQNSTE